MEKIITPAPILNNGWVFYTKCRCNGILKYKYRNPSKRMLELHWWVKYEKFLIIDGSKSRIPLTKITELETILTSL